MTNTIPTNSLQKYALGAALTGGSTIGTVGGAVVGGITGHEVDKK